MSTTARRKRRPKPRLERRQREGLARLLADLVRGGGRGDSTFLQAWVNLGGIWDNRADMMAPMPERQARTAKAVSMYQKALSIDPRDAKARCNLGALYMRDRKTEEAKKEFTTVLDQDPQSALAHYHLAVLFAEARIYARPRLSGSWREIRPDGDIGERSKANLKILEDLQKAPTPAAAKP